MHIEPGTTDVSISIYCRDTDGDELTGKLATNFALTYTRARAAKTAISLSDLAALTTAHTDGGIKEIGNGEYRLDLPDAACATGVTQVTVQGTVAGGYVLGYPIDLSSEAGTGTYSCTWTVNDGSTVLEGAQVVFWLAGVERGRATTNSSGQCSMSLNAGTYTVSISLSGYTFTSTTHVVSATSSTWTNTFSMTVVSIAAATDPGNVTGRIDMHLKDTTTGKYVSIFVRQTTRRTATGHGDSNEWRELVSDATGKIEAEFVKSLIYEAKRGQDGVPVTFTASTANFYLPSILGEP